MLYAVIMAGGAGTRFWPASRADSPKQLLDLAGGGTMLQNTVARLEGLCDPGQMLIVTNQRLVGPIRDQLPRLPASSVVGEPCKRDTAPCVGWSAQLVARQDPQATMAMMPADHVIRPAEQFQAAVRHAAQLVEENPRRIVTFGIPPTYPAETFGYIERGEWLQQSPWKTARVEQFREKPSAETAREYLETGRFYWNSGIFIWKAATIIDALSRFEPQMARHLEAIAAAAGTPAEQEVLEREFAAIEGKSIDYAVMERYEDEICVVEAPFEWDDLGSWRAMSRLLGEDEHGNTVVGRNLTVDSHGVIIRSDGDHLVAALGMRDCIIVHTPDATLVANKTDEEAIRQVVAMLKEQGLDAYL